MKMLVTISSADYENEGTEFDLYVARPATVSEPLPVILVAPAWDGLNEPIEEITRRVASLGYVAVAVDIYGKGVRGEPYGDNAHLMNPLVENRSTLRKRLLAGIAVVKDMDYVDGSRMGAIGYCFGGLCVLDLARAVPDSLIGVVSFHGGLTGNDLSDTTPIRASILIEHGWDDPVVPPDDYLEFSNEMDRRTADWQAHIHGGAVHAFTFEGANMPDKGIQYNEAAARRSWRSMCDFFGEIF
jgi:dienelactone hydrolase